MTSPGGSPTPDAVALVGLLAEEARATVFAAVVLGAVSVEEAVERSNLDRKAVVAALERLAGGGLVERDGAGRLRARTELFKSAARAAAEARPQSTIEHPEGSQEATAVLRNFVVDDRLVSIPTNRTKRNYVLDFLAGEFEPGKVYPEAAVNDLLARWHEDYAALRRYLVDEEYLERRDGFYWRAGGTVDVD